MKNSQEYIESILDDNEKVAVAQFISSEVMCEAVKKCLLAGIYGNGTLKKGEPADPLRNFLIGLAMRNPNMTDEQIGADLRASISGINSLEVAFDHMSKIKLPTEPKAAKPNQAR